MYYASFGILSLVLHIITNYEYLRRKKDQEISLAEKRYRQFLISVFAYYISDILWGYLYGIRLIPLAYADTILYFTSMVVSVLLWTRFVVTYLNRKDRFHTVLTVSGWAIFGFVVGHLIINFFNPMFFYYDENSEYVPGNGRYILLAMQVCLYLMVSVYSLITALKTEGKERNHNQAVGVSGLIMTVFIVLQTLYPELPFYAIGLLIGTCIVHIFVAEDIKINHALEMEKMKQRVEREHRVAVKATEKRMTFGEIVQGLASNYDVIYYVDVTDRSYTAYTANDIYGHLTVSDSGSDFFRESEKNAERLIHPDDRDRFIHIINLDYLLAALQDRKQVNADYQMIVDGSPQYTRLFVRKTRDGGHLIIGVENVDAEVRREKAHQEALDMEKKLARRDELTGTKNKNAYAELEESIGKHIEKEARTQVFAIVVCDINDLKQVNDTAGHKAGDDLIRSAAELICDTFAHSPVFRIGGDEFVVYLQGRDYQAREELVGRLRVKIMENKFKSERARNSSPNGADSSLPVIAVGVSEFRPDVDRSVSDVFERADERMYENKKELKEM